MASGGVKGVEAKTDAAEPTRLSQETAAPVGEPRAPRTLDVRMVFGAPYDFVKLVRREGYLAYSAALKGLEWCPVPAAFRVTGTVSCVQESCPCVLTDLFVLDEAGQVQLRYRLLARSGSSCEITFRHSDGAFYATTYDDDVSDGRAAECAPSEELTAPPGALTVDDDCGLIDSLVAEEGT
jgi:hypothetical protein